MSATTKGDPNITVQHSSEGSIICRIGTATNASYCLPQQKEMSDVCHNEGRCLMSATMKGGV